MNGLECLTRRVKADMWNVPEYKYAKDEMELSNETIRSIRRGMAVSMRIVQKFADLTEIPGPVAFTDPLTEITSDLLKSDLSYIPVNIERIRKERGLTIEQLANNLHMSSEKLEKIESSVILITTVEFQNIADALEVDVLDLTKPPSCMHDSVITHAKYLTFHARVQVNKIKLHNGSFNLNNDSVIKLTRGVGTMKISTVDKFSQQIGLGLAEMFLQPGIETEWYKDSNSVYFSKNMRREMDYKRISNSAMGSMIGMSKNTVVNIKCGQLTTVKTAQDIADVLELELGDMFLPLEG